MIDMTLHQAAALTGATLIGKPLRFRGVATDSRDDCHGRLFVALTGKKHDGHRYCQAAADAGARAVMVSQAQDVQVPQLLVQDTLAGFSALARAWHRQVSPLTFAVTGSNGKTTVKSMLAAVLAVSHKVHVTEGNFNNEIGVPVTLCRTPNVTEMAVIEMGAAQVGDIARLASLAKPHVAIITNISAAHSARFGSLSAIAEGKSELYEALGPDGIAVINRDDAKFERLKEKAAHVRQITFGRHPDSDVRLLAGEVMKLQLPDGQTLSCRLPVAGRHNAMNAAAAVAAAWSQNISLADMQYGLETFIPPAGRLQRRGKVNGVTVLDDSYNANPASVRAAIDVLCESPGPVWLILGDMAELGENSDRWHREVGEYARRKDIDVLWAVGESACLASLAMGSRGRCFQDKKQLVAALRKHWPEGGTMLFKASRSARMEEVVETLLGQEHIA